MVERKLVINFGQSNSGPFHDLETWLQKRLDLNLLLSSNRVGGAYSPTFVMPGKFPGFTNPLQLKGQAISNIRYLTAYNPSQSGTTSYPGTGRVIKASLEPKWANTATEVWVEQQFLLNTHQVGSVVRKVDGQTRVVSGVLQPSQFLFEDNTHPTFDNVANTIKLTAHGYRTDDPVRLVLTSGDRFVAGLSTSTQYYVTSPTANAFKLSLTPGGAAVAFGAYTGTVDSLWLLQLQETKSFAVGDVNITTDTITIASHGWPNGSRVLIESSGTRPGGLDSGGPFVVSDATTNTFKLRAATDYFTTPVLPGDLIDITSVGVGTHTATLLPPLLGGSRLKFAVAWDPLPIEEEEFTHPIKVTESSAGTTLKLSLGFGIRKAAGSLRGIQINAGASSRIIGDWDNTTMTATLHDPDNPANTLALSVTAGDVVTLTPPGGGAFDRWAYFLPWSMFETDLSDFGGFIAKVNPYPPGFDYPGQFHTPQVYSTDQQVPAAVPGTGGLFNLTVRPQIAWHTSFLVRLSEFFGEEVWCVSTDFGGTSATHVEPQIGEGNIGWYDQAQQTDWSMARANSCFQRWLDELDMAIAAAAEVGDTLKVIGVFRNQGFADATSGSDPTYGPTEDQSSVPADKFYEVNKAFRRRVRAELKARGLWDGDAAEIPWVQPLEQLEAADLPIIGDLPSLLKVRAALQRLADEDDFAETWDQTGLPTGPDGIHFTGAAVAMEVEEETFNAFQKILQRADRSGEVSICNLALTHIGAAAIVTSISPPDGSAEAAHCATFYRRARNSVLEAHNWAFATKRRVLTEVESDASSYGYAYLLPSDAQRVISILPPGADDDHTTSFYGNLGGLQSTSPGGNFDSFGRPFPPSAVVITQPYVIGRLPNGSEVIYTDQPEAVLRYVARVSDTTQYPELFVLALSWQLAAMLAGPIIKGPAGAQMADRCMRMAMFYLSKASASDGNQQKVEPEHTAPWMSARL